MTDDGFRLFECEVCGAVASAPNAHRDWHMTEEEA